jgi:hypothetical protein
MKQTVETFAVRLSRVLAPTGAAAALVLAAAAPQALAVAPVVDIKIEAGPKRVDGRIVTSMMRWWNTFTTDTPGAPPFTIQQAVLMFPDRTNGRYFPSCNAAQITRDGIGGCPKDSKIGAGRLTAQVLPVGIPASGRVTAFNSHRGRSITFNIRTTQPAVIDVSFDAPLTYQRGSYPQKLVMDVPPSLQEVIPGLFVGLQTFNMTISGVTKSHGKRHHFLPLVCPKHGLRGEFHFMDSTTREPATAVTDADLDCHDLT